MSLACRIVKANFIDNFLSAIRGATANVTRDQLFATTFNRESRLPGFKIKIDQIQLSTSSGCTEFHPS
ncbi:hypothetical protein JTB14_030576 [Gonioctena quinquepunctata]|nr:hypothetical protein JTB14_030576 [Gonioctena quinquepunctata]